MGRRLVVVACGMVCACISPFSPEEVGRAVQWLIVGNEVSFPSPSVSPIAAIPGPVSIVPLAHRRWVGFASGAGFQRVTVDDQWTVRSAGAPMTAAWGVVAGQGSTLLGAWNVGHPVVALHIGAFSSTGAVMGSPTVFPTIGPSISNPPTSGPALAAFGSGALVAWPSVGGGAIVVRVVRVNAAGAPLDPVAGVAISTPGQPTDSLSIACLTTSCPLHGVVGRRRPGHAAPGRRRRVLGRPGCEDGGCGRGVLGLAMLVAASVRRRRRRR